MLAPIRLSLGAFTGDARIAPELRRVDHFDVQLLFIGKREELPGDGKDPIDLILRDAVAGEIEETDIARRRTQIPQERLPGRFVALQLADVNHGYDARHSGLLTRMFNGLGGRLACASADQRNGILSGGAWENRFITPES